MKVNVNKNLIYLGAFIIIFFGASNVASACDPSNPASCYNYTNNGGYYNNQPYSNNIDNNFPPVTNSYYSSGSPVSYGYNTYTYGSNVNPYNNPQYVDYGNTNTTNSTNGVSSNTTNTTNTRTITNTTNKVDTTTKATTKENDTANTTNTTDVKGEASTTNQASSLSANGLTALSLQGSSSFMPDTVWEWICVFFLMLAIIILIRQFRSQPKHEVHAVAHH